MLREGWWVIGIDSNTPKQKMLAILQGQPEDSSFDELLRELACNNAVRKGLEDVEQGRTVSNSETHRRINKSWYWLVAVLAALLVVKLIGIVEKSQQEEQLEKLESKIAQLEQTVNRQPVD